MQKLREPLPLDVAATVRAHNSRSPIDLSPDGAWVAHTYAREETIPRDTIKYSATGVPFGEGDRRMQAILTHTKTGQVVRLGGVGSSSWAPVWSPDGRRVAFYSDEGGQAGLWMWDRATGNTERFPGVIVRPFFGFEIVRWMADSQRLLCKILPAGLSISAANALVPDFEETRRFEPVATGKPSVFVLRSKAGEPSRAPQPNVAPTPSVSMHTNRALADLAVLDWREHTVTRLVERTKPLWYRFSPDEKYLAYTVLQGWEPNSQQPLYDLMLFEMTTGAARTLGENLRLHYGIELNWSPDSQRLAYITGGQLASGEIVVVSVADGGVRKVGGEGGPNFNDGEGERSPLWDLRGENIYALAKDEKLWRIALASGKPVIVGGIPGHAIRGVVSRADTSTLWSGDGGRTAWLITRELEGQKAGIYRIDLMTGASRRVTEEPKQYLTTFNLDASDVSRELAFVASDQQHLPDVWMLDTTTGRARQGTRLNPSLDRYELGSARLIEWYGAGGERLRGALLLPPGHQRGRRVPLVVWIYGGSDGSRYVNRFGLAGELPVFNFHVLATRGYAVLYPDAPLRVGTPMRDLVDTVMPGVNAAIEQGYADPERLAVMGQSYGSYCTLALITQTTRFKAAVITAAVLHPDLFSDYLTMSADGVSGSTGYYEQGQGNMGGTPWEYRDRYFNNSPLFLFDRIETPLLIAQGTKDGRLIASDAIFVALRRLGKEVEYRLYENEEHAITRKPNVLDFWQRRLAFLSEHLNLIVDDNGAIIRRRDPAAHH